MKGSDYATGKSVNMDSPEEGVRQEYERILVESYAYPKNLLDIEVRIPRGSGYFPDRAQISLSTMMSVAETLRKTFLGLLRPSGLAGRTVSTS